MLVYKPFKGGLFMFNTLTINPLIERAINVVDSRFDNKNIDNNIKNK